MREPNTRPRGHRNRRLLSRHRYFDSVHDLDQTRELVAAKYCSHEMNLIERSSTDAWMNVVEGQSLLYSSLGYGAASVVNPGATESFFPVMIPLSGGGTVQVGHQRGDVSTEMAAVVSATEPLRMKLSSDCTLLIVCIDRDALESRVSAMIGDSLSEPLRFTLDMDLINGRAAPWYRQVLEDVADLDSQDSLILATDFAARYSEQRLINSLLVLQPHNYSERIPMAVVHGIPAQRGEPIGALIERARQQCGLSQYGLADVLAALSGNESVSRDEVKRWERGKRVPGPYWQRRLSVALGLPFDRLSTAARSARRGRRLAGERVPRAIAHRACQGGRRVVNP